MTFLSYFGSRFHLNVLNGSFYIMQFFIVEYSIHNVDLIVLIFIHRKKIVIEHILNEHKLKVIFSKEVSIQIKFVL